MTFSNAVLVSEGTHALIYKAIATVNDDNFTCCLKLYRKNWMTPFNLECTAYGRLLRAGVDQRYIPKIYGFAKRTLSQWGVSDIGQDEQDGFYGLIIEWIETGQRITPEDLTIDHAVTLINGLRKIHDAEVLHFDVFDRNILIIPGSKRAVWLDFSCAQFDEPDSSYDQEMYIAAGVILQYV